MTLTVGARRHTAGARGALLLLLTVAFPAGIHGNQGLFSTPATDCGTTVPNGIVADGGEAVQGSHGNRQLSVGPFGLWPEGTVIFQPGGTGFVTRDGSLGMKFGWQLGVRGRLQIEGRRLDSTAPPLRAEAADSEGIGFQATYLIFPSAGCWQVTARVGEVRLTFVTKVVKIGEGPSWKRDVP